MDTNPRLPLFKLFTYLVLKSTHTLTGTTDSSADIVVPVPPLMCCGDHSLNSILRK